MKNVMNVCIISKFPPIQGGMATSAYWLARDLSQDPELKVIVLTNSNIVEKEYLINDCYINNEEVDVKFISTSDQFVIPQRNYDIAGFLESFIEVSQTTSIDIIDAQYLIPYGIVAYIIHKMFRIPYILRHGGSDIARFLNNGIYKSLLIQVISNATIVDSQDGLVCRNSTKCVSLPTYVPSDLFNESGRSTSSKIRIAYIGKMPVLYQTKDLHNITFEEFVSSHFAMERNSANEVTVECMNC